MRGGGAERFITILLRHIDRSKLQPLLCLVRKEGPLLAELPGDIQIIDLKSEKARFAVFKIIELIRKKMPDMVFSTLGHLNLMIMILRPFLPNNIKFIARETNIPSINIGQSPIPRVLSFLYHSIYRNYHKVICQSEDMQGDLIKNFGFPSNKTVVINNPIDVDCINEYLMGKEKDLLPSGRINILAAGKFKYQKGFDLLLKAISYLNDKRVHLTLLGKGPQENNLKKLARKLNIADQVTFAGYIENPYPYMAQADIFVLSSRFEGFPNVVLESMACGTPVVAFECPGGINEIIEDGVNGWKVKPGDIPGLGDSILNAFETKWDYDLIKDRTKERFAAGMIINKYQEIFLS